MSLEEYSKFQQFFRKLDGDADGKIDAENVEFNKINFKASNIVGKVLDQAMEKDEILNFNQFMKYLDDMKLREELFQVVFFIFIFIIIFKDFNSFSRLNA